MSTVYTNVSESPSHVVDPITHQVISSLIGKLGITNLFDDNENVNIHHERSANSPMTDPSGLIRLETDNRLDVTVETNYNPGSDQWFTPNSDYNTPSQLLSSIYKKTYRQVFLDAPVNMSCQEITVPCSITMQLRFASKSFDQMLFIMEQISNISGRELVNDARDICYAYPMNMSALTVLYAVWKYRNTWKEQNPGKNFLDYIKAITQGKIGIGVRRRDLTEDSLDTFTKYEWQYLIKHHQLSTIGQLRCDASRPSEERDGNLPTHYFVEAEYKVFFSRPKLLQFTLPPSVEQHMLPNTLFKDTPKNADYNLAGGYTDPSYNDTAYLLNGGPNRLSTLLRLPSWDDWFIPTNSPVRRNRFVPFVIGVVTLDSVGGNTSISLKDLDNAPITPFALNILSRHTQEDILGFNGLFNVTVYSNNLPLDQKFIGWDSENQKVTFTADRPENVYRLVVSQASVLDYIDPKWTKTIIEFRYYFPMLLMRSFDYLARQGHITFGAGDELTGLIAKLRHKDRLDDIFDQMIKYGNVPETIKYLARTDGQLADVLCNTSFKSNYIDVNGERTGALFDVFIKAALDLGYITRNEVPWLRINATNGLYPYQINGIATNYYNNDTKSTGANPNGYNQPFRRTDQYLRATRRGRNFR